MLIARETHERREKLFSVFRVFRGPCEGLDCAEKVKIGTGSDTRERGLGRELLLISGWRDLSEFLEHGIE